MRPEEIDNANGDGNILSRGRYKISLKNIVGLFVGGTIASLAAFVLAKILGLSVFLTYIFAAAANSVWWIAGYQRRSSRLDWDSLQARFLAIDRKLMLLSVAGGLALSALPDVTSQILARSGVKLAEIPANAMIPGDLGQLSLAILVVVILAALAEELMFRGLMLDWLKQKIAAWQAILIISLFFALLHDNHLRAGLAGWIELGDRFLMGVGTSIIAIRGRSLRGSFVMHATNNLIACVTA
jgi:membrane protease YdiL (CAAX protease family)